MSLDWDSEKHTAKEFPYIEVTVRAYDTRPREWPSGEVSGLLTFYAFATDVSIDNEKVGFIGGGLGSVVVSVQGDDGHYLMIPHDDLWYAVQEGIKNGFTEPES